MRFVNTTGVSCEGRKKAEVSERGTTHKSVAQHPHSATCSIADLTQNVNPKNTDFTEYFPKNLLTEEQKIALQTVSRPMLSEGIKIESADGSFSDNSGTSPRSDTDSIYSIADLFDFVKRFDSDFKPIPVNKDLLNADGTPKLFYHGAKNGGGFSEFRDWSYFTENRGIKMKPCGSPMLKAPVQRPKTWLQVLLLIL